MITMRRVIMDLHQTVRYCPILAMVTRKHAFCLVATDRLTVGNYGEVNFYELSNYLQTSIRIKIIPILYDYVISKVTSEIMVGERTSWG